MAKTGTYTSTVTPSGPNGSMVVGGSSGSYTVTYAGNTCTVDQNASSGNALKFSYTSGNTTYTFNGACPNSTYAGTCVTSSSSHAHPPAPMTDDNWTATATQTSHASSGKH